MASKSSSGSVGSAPPSFPSIPTQPPEHEDGHGMKHKEKLNLITGTMVMPGQKLCLANEYYESGVGTYEFGNFIYGSILGWLEVEEFPDQELTVLSVKNSSNPDKEPFIGPQVGSIVTATVVSRTKKLCRVLITHVGTVSLADSVKGIIRREYITDKQRDQVEIVNSFGIGDIVLARVVGIGEGDFILSTAEDALGVAAATSKAGFYMIPIGWTQMECPQTKEVQPRKVAKIIDQNVEYWKERNSAKIDK